MFRPQAEATLKIKKNKKKPHKSQCILEPQSQGRAHLTAKQAGVYPGLECDIHSVKNKLGASKSAQGSGGGDGLHLRPGCCLPGSLGWESCRSVIQRGQDHCQLLAAFSQSYTALAPVDPQLPVHPGGLPGGSSQVTGPGHGWPLTSVSCQVRPGELGPTSSVRK